MKRFTESGRQAIADGNLYAALSLALTIPDICASLEDPGPGKTQPRYIRWCKQWVEPKFTRNSRRGTTIFLTAEDCFQLRCSLIHSGSAEIAPAKQDILSRVVFFDGTAGSHLNLFQGNTVNGVPMPNFLQLEADKFSNSLFEAAEEWDEAAAGNPQIQREKARLLVIHTKGAVVHGFQFS